MGQEAGLGRGYPHCTNHRDAHASLCCQLLHQGQCSVVSHIWATVASESVPTANNFPQGLDSSLHGLGSLRVHDHRAPPRWLGLGIGRAAAPYDVVTRQPARRPPCPASSRTGAPRRTKTKYDQRVTSAPPIKALNHSDKPHDGTVRQSGRPDVRHVSTLPSTMGLCRGYRLLCCLNSCTKDEHDVGSQSRVHVTSGPANRPLRPARDPR